MLANFWLKKKIQYTAIQVIVLPQKLILSLLQSQQFLISAKGHPQSQHWRRIAKQTYSHFPSSYVNLLVEIINQELGIPLGCWRYGRNGNPQENPKPPNTIPTWRDNCGWSTNFTNGKNIAISSRPRLQDIRTLWKALIQEDLDHEALFVLRVN